MTAQSREREWRYATSLGPSIGPEQNAFSLRGRIRYTLRELYANRYVLSTFTISRFRATYRAQALGVWWPVANPLVLMLVMSITFGVVFPPPSEAYPVTLMIGLVIWHYLTHVVSDGKGCLLDHAAVLKKTAVPGYVIAIGTALSHVFTLAFAMLSILPLAMFYPEAFHLTSYLLLIPFLLLCLVIFAMGATLIASVLNVYYRDVGYIVDSFMLVFFWLTPVIYPLDKFSESSRAVFLLNPMASIITCARDIVMWGRLPSGLVFAAASGTSLAVLLIGILVYRRLGACVSDHV